MKSFDEFGIKKHKIILIQEYPCQNRKQPEKKKGEYLENDKNCFKTLMAGLEHNITMPQENITLKKQKDTKYSNKEY